MKMNFAEKLKKLRLDKLFVIGEANQKGNRFIKIQSDLPARAILEQENIFVMDETRATTQDIRPLKILVLNAFAKFLKRSLIFKRIFFAIF